MNRMAFVLSASLIAVLHVTAVVVEGFQTLVPPTFRCCDGQSKERSYHGRTSCWGTLSSSSSSECDVAVFGGGFGGLYTALALSREAQRSGRKLDIALVEPSDRFVFLPLLYDLTVGTASEAEVCPRYKDILADTGVRHIQSSLYNFSATDSVVVAATTTTTLSHPPDTTTAILDHLTCRHAAVVSVGASPGSILASVPGATEYVQPFYTKEDAYATKRLLQSLESQIENGYRPRIAVVGGGYGGVELAACIQRRLSKKATVTLLARSAPMKGTRAEPLVAKALDKLGVTVELSSVQAITLAATTSTGQPPNKKRIGDRFLIQRTPSSSTNSDDDAIDMTYDNEDSWDAILWTAGTMPATPVVAVSDCSTGTIQGLAKVAKSGCLSIDDTLRCLWDETTTTNTAASSSSSSFASRPPVWSLGDCSEIVSTTTTPEQQQSSPLSVPKTAQAAMQQAEVVASNVLLHVEKSTTKEETCFQFQDLGSMLSLGGPNAAVLAPQGSSTLGPIFAPLLDTASQAFELADRVLLKDSSSSVVVEDLGLSLGGYGLGVDAGDAPGTLSGTLAGAARRAVYAIRMPTNQQRAYSFASAALSTAAALAKEAAAASNNNKNS